MKIIVMQVKRINYNTQLELFQDSMKTFVLFGKYLGIFPLAPEERKTKYTSLNWRYAITFVICLSQIVCLILCILGIVQTSVNIGKISHVLFYAKNCVCNILLMKLAMRWNDLKKELSSIDLREYIDPCIKFKCSLSTFVLAGLTIFNTFIGDMSKLAATLDCHYSTDTSIFEQYALRTYSWLFRLGIPYSVPLGILLVTINVLSSLCYSFIQIIVINISLYLSSIIQQFNKKIHSLDCKYVAMSYWLKLRQDYNQVSRLVRSFDDVINGIVFVSFACNLYLVCLQVYFLLRCTHENLRYYLYMFNYFYHRSDVTIRQGFHVCPENTSSGFLKGYDKIISNVYFVYSSTYYIVRSFVVSFTAAKVHSASMEIAPILYHVPPGSYCIEVQRFIEQIHGNTIALSGLNFFYCTKEVILSMISTVITYELVLLQFN